MARRPQVSVIGYDSTLCTEIACRAAYEVGRAVAERGGVVISGGLGGVMEAASKGAKEAGGLSIGIIPTEEIESANPYCDIVIPSGFGYARNFLVVNSGDAIIIVGGGAGTLTEAAASYGKAKAIVAVKGTGGVADDWADKYFDERKTVMVSGAATADAAVQMAFRSINKGQASLKRRR